MHTPGTWPGSDSATRTQPLLSGSPGVRRTEGGPLPLMTEPPPAVSAETLDSLRDDARHERNRLALYRAKVLGSRPTSPGRLRELERASARAEQRLANALRLQPQPPRSP